MIISLRPNAFPNVNHVRSKHSLIHHEDVSIGQKDLLASGFRSRRKAFNHVLQATALLIGPEQSRQNNVFHEWDLLLPKYCLSRPSYLSSTIWTFSIWYITNGLPPSSISPLKKFPSWHRGFNFTLLAGACARGKSLAISSWANSEDDIPQKASAGRQPAHVLTECFHRYDTSEGTHWNNTSSSLFCLSISWPQSEALLGRKPLTCIYATCFLLSSPDSKALMRIEMLWISLLLASSIILAETDNLPSLTTHLWPQLVEFQAASHCFCLRHN